MYLPEYIFICMMWLKNAQAFDNFTTTRTTNNTIHQKRQPAFGTGYSFVYTFMGYTNYVVAAPIRVYLNLEVEDRQT